MCRACMSAAVTDRLMSGAWTAAPSRRRFLAAAVSAGVAAALPGSREARAAGAGAEVVFRNGAIYPMTGAGTTVEAVAIGGGRILAAGTAADVASLAGDGTKTVDLKGRALFPGFIDPHHHTVLAALLQDLFVDVGYALYPTRADALAGLAALAAKTPKGEWIRARSYDNLLQGGMLSKADLDAAAPDNPVFVLYVNGHTAAANSKGLAAAKITESVGAFPGGGRFGRGPDGQLDGTIYEESAILHMLGFAAPPMTPERIASAVVAYAKTAAAAGNTTLHEPGTIKAEWVAPLARLSNGLPVRLSASLAAPAIRAGEPFVALGPATKARRIPDSRLSLYGAKFWADGSLQQETAALTKPYLRGDGTGAMSYTPSGMADMCRAARDAGWPILIHCQGDRAIDDALEAIETVYGANPATGLNVVQHATMLRKDQIERIQRLGAGVTFDPDLFGIYGGFYRDALLGPARADAVEPMAACLEAGLPFSLHTDAPVAPPGPLRLVETAVTRRCRTDGSILGPGQAVPVHEALKAITVHAARHIGLSDAIGTLEPGKEADLTILESDPHGAAPDAIAAIRVSETWVAGEKPFG